MPYNEQGVGYREVSTSIQAGEDVAMKAANVRLMVLGALTRGGPMTSDELAAELGIDYRTVQPRTSELRAAGRIVDSGRVAYGPHGKRVTVWAVRADRKDA